MFQWRPYSRQNVPTLNQATLNKLKQIHIKGNTGDTVYDRLFVPRKTWGQWIATPGELVGVELFGSAASKGTISGNDGQVAIQYLEEALYEAATNMGILIYKGWTATGAKSLKSGEVRLQVTNQQRKQGYLSSYFSTYEETSDLVVVATGAGAYKDDFVTSTLGFNTISRE
ncbi:MAG TPA: hypothetical protein VH640_02230 [Bryobacteraceae bacterium]